MNAFKIIRWTIDYPALYWELLDNNVDALGAPITGLCYLLMGLENIYRLAKRENNKAVLNELKHLGIDAAYFAFKKKRLAKYKSKNVTIEAARAGKAER